MAEVSQRTKTTRNAGPAITGYAYQFDLTILEILAAGHDADVFVEACEDIDIRAADSATSIQCKYLETQNYSLTAIRDAVMPMLRSFSGGNKWDYRLYIHFSDESVEPPMRLSVDELKICLTEQKRKPIRKTILHYEGIPDDVLDDFVTKFKIIVGPAFRAQRTSVYQALSKAIHGSLKDAEEVHYGNALAHVIDLSISPLEEDRCTTRSAFLAKINKRPALFTRWHRELLGEEKFLRSAQAMLKRSRALTATTRRGVIVGTNGPGESPDVAQMVHLVEFLAKSGFGVGHLTSAVPWTILLDTANEDITAIKRGLAVAGVRFNDGYEDYSFNVDLFDEAPVVNTKPRSSSVARASYSVRLLSAQNYTKHATELKPLKTLISFADLEPSRYTAAVSLVNSAHVPAVGVDKMIAFLRGAQ